MLTYSASKKKLLVNPKLRIEEWIKYDTIIEERMKETYATNKDQVESLFGFHSLPRGRQNVEHRTFEFAAFNFMKEPLTKTLKLYFTEPISGYSPLSVIKNPSKHIHLYDKTVKLNTVYKYDFNKSYDDNDIGNYIQIINDINMEMIEPLIKCFENPMIKLVIAFGVVEPIHGTAIFVWKESNKYKFGVYESVWKQDDSMILSNLNKIENLQINVYNNLIIYNSINEVINSKNSKNNTEEDLIDNRSTNYFTNKIKQNLQVIESNIHNKDIGSKIEFINLSVNCPKFIPHSNPNSNPLIRCPQYYYDTQYCHIYVMQVIIYFMDLFAKEFPLQESPEGSPLLKNPYRQTLARSPVDTGECFGFFCNVKLPKKKRGGMGSSGADTKELSGDIVNDLIRQAIVKSLHTEDMTKIGKKNTLETMIYNAMTLINANILLIVYYQRLEKLRPRNETAEITQELINLKCGLKMILAVILGRDTEDFYGLFKLTREDKCKMANFEKFSDYYTWDALYKEVVKGT